MNILYQFKLIKTFVFDVDGVLTDGTLLVLNDGQMTRRMNIKDGYALQLAIKKGYRVVVISGGNSEALKERLYKLKVRDVFMQVDNKQELLINYVKIFVIKEGFILNGNLYRKPNLFFVMAT